jgi:hypothetical protein
MLPTLQWNLFVIVTNKKHDPKKRQLQNMISKLTHLVMISEHTLN